MQMVIDENNCHGRITTVIQKNFATPCWRIVKLSFYLCLFDGIGCPLELLSACGSVKTHSAHKARHKMVVTIVGTFPEFFRAIRGILEPFVASFALEWVHTCVEHYNKAFQE